MQLALVDVRVGLMARRNKGSLIKRKDIRASKDSGGGEKQ